VDLTVSLAPPALCIAGGVVACAALACAVLRAPWWWLRQPGSVHVLCGAVVILLGLWQLRAGIGGGPWLHLLGATALTLMFSWQFALLGCAVLVFGSAATGHGDVVSAGLNFTLSGLLPVAFSYGFARLIERVFAPHFFIYVFVTAFLGAALAVGLVVVATGFVALAGAAVTTTCRAASSSCFPRPSPPVPA